VQTPPVHIEEPDDEVLSAIPESAESATQVVGENDAPEIDEAEDAEPAEEIPTLRPRPPRTWAARREIDPDVRDILRSRRNARPVCARPRPIRWKPRRKCRSTRRRKTNTAPGGVRNSRMPRTPFAVGAASAGHANGSRRDLLPDIEEINSTLRATEDRGGERAGRRGRAGTRGVAQRRRGVRLGFFVTLALTAGLIWVYVNADMLSETRSGRRRCGRRVHGPSRCRAALARRSGAQSGGRPSDGS
jgi:hypothetical protein